MSTGTVALSPVAEQARSHDRDRYLCCLFAPPEMRESLLALVAFNADIAHIGDAVSEEMMGLIRFTWWREAVDEIYTGEPPRRHPVVEVLHAMVPFYSLTRGYFDQLITAREHDLDTKPFATLEQMETYAEATSSSLLQLWLEVLEIDDPRMRDAARHLGIAWALLGMLRAIPYRAVQGKLLLPEALSDGVSLESLQAGRALPALRKAVMHIVAMAEKHMRHANNAFTNRRSLPLKQLLLISQHYVARIRRTKGDVFDHAIDSGRTMLQLKLLWNSVRS